jgi:hypothetical protein
MKIQVYSDPGHGWAKVPMTQIKNWGLTDRISPYSYLSPCGKFAYLEEDDDLSLLLHRLGQLNIKPEIQEHHTDSESVIRCYPSYPASENWRENRKQAY